MNKWFRIQNEEQIPSPTVLVYPERIAANIAQMITVADGPENLRPHVKTHKMPQIIRMKLAAGIHKFKVATIAEAEMTLVAGASDVLLAYPLVGPNILRFVRLRQEFPYVKLSALIDNEDTLHEIEQTAKNHNQVVDLFVDINVGMNRTGIQPDERAVNLYKRMHQFSHVRPVGLHAYDGHLHEDDPNRLKALAAEAFRGLFALRDELLQLGFKVPVIVASGTPTSPIMARHRDIEVSPGTTVLWDQGQLKLTPDQNYLHAAILFGRIVSRPTSDTICIDIGHKAVASEMPQPRIHWLNLPSTKVVMHSEEHLVLQMLEPVDCKVGMPVYGVPMHVCPTIALHQAVWCVRDGVATERWEVVARNRMLRF